MTRYGINTQSGNELQYYSAHPILLLEKRGERKRDEKWRERKRRNKERKKESREREEK